MSYILALDFETGGYSELKNPILSLGVVLGLDGEIIDSLHFYVKPNPNKIIKPDAMRITGYSPERWKEFGEIPLEVGLSMVEEWLSDKEIQTVLAHNADFDRRFLRQAEKETGIYLEKLAYWTCTQQLFKYWRDENKAPGSCKLDELCELIGEARDSNHNALQDAILCYKGYCFLTQNHVHTSVR
jgi:DNA polymerase III epsilon subunit-like protein